MGWGTRCSHEGCLFDLQMGSDDIGLPAKAVPLVKKIQGPV